MTVGSIRTNDRYGTPQSCYHGHEYSWCRLARLIEGIVSIPFASNDCNVARILLIWVSVLLREKCQKICGESDPTTYETIVSSQSVLLF